MRRPRIRLLPLLAALAAPALAQTLHFSDGRVVPLTPAVRITNDGVRLPLELEGGGSGEISLPLASLARVDWPRPAELDAAEAALAAGLHADALRNIDAIIPLQQPLAEVPGSWWAPATLLRVSALAGLERDIDAEVEIERLRRSASGAALVPSAEIALASAWAAAGKNTEAAARLEKLDRAALPDSARADLHLLEARLLRARGRHEDALLACLRVPVLLPAETARLPAALLLSAECYSALDEPARRDAALRSLVERFPESPEADRARRLLSGKS